MTFADFLHVNRSATGRSAASFRHLRLARRKTTVLAFAIRMVLSALALTTVAFAGPTLTGPKPSPQNVNAGANVTFTVNVLSHSGTLTYQWQFSPSPANPQFVNLTDGAQATGSTVSGSTTPTLQITSAQPGDTGRYRCLVSDSTGASNSGPARLNVAAGLPFTLTPPSPSPQTAYVGSNVTFTVTASGQSGSLSFQWQFSPSPNSPPYANVTDGLQQSNSTAAGSNTATLHINNVHLGDSGRYRCLVTDLATSTTKNSGPGTLTVTPQPSTQLPVINVNPTNQSVGPGETGIFNVQATNPLANQPLTYAWQVLSNGSFTDLTDGNGISGSKTPELQVANAQSDATYQCQVTNTVGSKNSQSATLTVGSLPRPQRPDDELQELSSLIQTGAPLGKYNWQGYLTTDGLNPWTGEAIATGSENLQVVAAAVGLWYGPAFTVDGVPTDYRCWWQNFLEEQTSTGGHYPTSSGVNNFQAREIGSFDYTGWVDTAIAAVYAWTLSSQAKDAPSPGSPGSCPGASDSIGAPGTVAGIQNAASAYLRDAVGLYTLAAGKDPALAGFGVTGWVNSNINPPVQTPSPFNQPDVAFTFIPLQASGDGPYVAFAGQRSLAGYWAGDQRQPVLCSALTSRAHDSTCSAPGFSCDPNRSLTGQNDVLTSTQVGKIWNDIFSCQDVENMGNFIMGGQNSFDPNAFVGQISTFTPVDLLGWTTPYVRATCMHNQVQGFNPATLGVVFWDNGSAGPSAGGTSGAEADFLYDGCTTQTDCTSGSTCKLGTSGAELDGSDARISLRRLYLPPGTPAFHYVLDSIGPGLHAVALQQQTAIPTLSPDSGAYSAVQTITISDATPGATIYYTTDGTVPTESSNVYTGPFTVSTGTIVNAIASYPGFDDSTVASSTYVLQTAAPVFTPPGGTYNAAQQITLSDTTYGTTIYYTTDGSQPSTSSTVYSGPITVSSGTTINAIAVTGGFTNSPTAGATYVLQAATPTFSLAAGTYTAAQSVTLSDATSGATIHCTTDGSTPTAGSPICSAAISVNTTTTINAIATYAGFNNSAVASATYTIHLPPPTTASISPVNGSTGGGTAITITGTNFVNGATVTLAGIAATGVTVVNSSQITATAPAHSAAGSVTVVVTNPDGQTGTLANSFSYFVPVNNISWVKPSGVTFGPANTLTVDGSALNGPSPVTVVWRDVTLNGSWNTIGTPSTPDGGGSWANTIPTSNYCHSYAVYANYLNVSSPTFNYVGVGSAYCSENAYIDLIEPPSLAGFGPTGSLVVQGNATGAPAGTTVAFFWMDATAGTGWNQTSPATPNSSGTWYNYIPNVNYSHQYNVYAVYDAFDTRNGQGVCAYTADGGATWCPQ